MGWWRMDADTLAGGRFVVSPLAETIACLQAFLTDQAAHPAERAWLDAGMPAFRARTAADPVDALLARVGLTGDWNADFLTPTPTGEPRDFAAEVEQVRAASPDTARADLAVSAKGPLPPLLDRPDLPERAATLYTWFWAELVEPTWPRRRRVLEADIVARTDRLGRHGWAAAVADLPRGKRWLGDGRLQVNTRAYPPREISGNRLLLVPVTPRRGWVSWHDDRNAIVYPCAGVLAEPPAATPEALARLLGPGRAAVLVLLDAPKSTTQLVALTGQGLGSVGRHLKVLLDARLVHRRRAGRSVLYYRSPAGDALVHAQKETTA
ncbi:ArsR/SmtB family transcription factor [Actinomadura hibisca]|uniref:ArsR/SmtB family transcription factor n=1 Tax=Actinomadura hibisca TaxID=68565 RepID=UPI000833496D|nr:helix-turn-helix domain-containing protein [Actinomadura hibisca]